MTFKNISTAAPSMGLAGRLYAVAEILSGKAPIIGQAALWSTLLPCYREAAETH